MGSECYTRVSTPLSKRRIRLGTFPNTNLTHSFGFEISRNYKYKLQTTNSANSTFSRRSVPFPAFGELNCPWLTYLAYLTLPRYLLLTHLSTYLNHLTTLPPIHTYLQTYLSTSFNAPRVPSAAQLLFETLKHPLLRRPRPDSIACFVCAE